MESFILQHESTLRLSAFVGIFAACALAEWLRPRRAQSLGRKGRWPANLGIVVLNTVVLRLIFPAAAVGAAADAQHNGWGLLNLFDLPGWLAVLLAMLALDFAIYWQHRLSHLWAPLWRLHRVHHTDLEFDVSTALRFHPLEILLSMLYKIALVYLLGAPLLAVLLFEMLLTGCAMFNHSNLRLPIALDAALRRLLVTPDMHRVHHSVDSAEHNRNFGFSVPWWDRLCGSYQAQPAAGHEQMRIGLQAPRAAQTCARLPGLLGMPFNRFSAAMDRSD